MNNIIDFEKFYLKINYEFKNRKYLESALTHSSYQNEHFDKKQNNNQRLEFLGDAVLELVISEELYLKNKSLMEGELSQLRSKIVNENALYKIAVKLDLGSFMLFGKGEFKQSGKYKPSILADAMEAIFGAIYLDAGYDVAKRIILDLCVECIEQASIGSFNTDYKTILQEFAQKVKDRNIEYVFTNESGPAHDKIFYYNLYFDGSLIAQGNGKSKKKAQQMAAKNALMKLGEINE